MGLLESIAGLLRSDCKAGTLEKYYGTLCIGNKSLHSTNESGEYRLCSK